MVIKFDQIAHTKNGFIPGVIMHPHANQVVVLAKVKLSYQQAQQILGHAGSQAMRWTAGQLAWELPNKNTGKCISCPIAKACQQNLNKQTTRIVNKIGDLFCSDTSSSKTMTFGGSKFGH